MRDGPPRKVLRLVESQVNQVASRPRLVHRVIVGVAIGHGNRE